MRIARHVHRETGQERLCLAGGVALNCVANGRLLREGPFEEIWIQPAAGDAGGALGTALFIWHQLLENERRAQPGDSQSGTRLGPSYSSDEIRAFLDERGAPYRALADESSVCAEVVDLLVDEKVVGWMQGAMEFGPRALGSRSILGDARSVETQTTMNLKIKYRESFRPFAPSVLRERASDYFSMDVSEDSPYMLIVAPVAPAKLTPPPAGTEELKGLDRLKIPRSEVPAITHIDGSARVQTVDRDRDPLYWALLSELDRRTGCPLVVNTSFNVRGEPIVCTPADAYRCFLATEMDALVMGEFLLLKEEQSDTEIRAVRGYERDFDLD
jgi:carbamoyltransferase